MGGGAADKFSSQGDGPRRAVRERLRSGLQRWGLSARVDDGLGSSVGGVSLSPEQLQHAYRHLPLRDFGEQFDKKVPYLNNWVQHFQYDDYWKQRGMDYRYSAVTVPALNIG